jgi:hypothetical protein
MAQGSISLVTPTAITIIVLTDRAREETNGAGTRRIAVGQRTTPIALSFSAVAFGDRYPFESEGASVGLTGSEAIATVAKPPNTSM